MRKESEKGDVEIEANVIADILGGEKE